MAHLNAGTKRCIEHAPIIYTRNAALLVRQHRFDGGPRVANLEKRGDCKGKGCQTADHMTVSASLFVRRSGSFSEEPGAPSVGGEEKIPRRCLVILPGKVDDHRVAVQVQGEYQD